MKASVIVNTYNRPKALSLCLEGYLRQTAGDFEIVIADDGSGEETRAVIERYKSKSPFPMEHVWQEDKGHRRTRILNRAAMSAKASYLIFSDGDCIPADNFVEAHLAGRREGTFLNGRRLLLTREQTDSLTADSVREGKHLSLDVSKTLKELRRFDRKFVFYRLIRNLIRLRLMAANFSIYLSDLKQVNGFDERYQGWGAADDDLRRRLLRAGVHWGSVMQKAFVYHLEHPPVAGKPKKVKEGRNIAYHDKGFFITKCMEGLEERSLGDLSTVIEYSSPSAIHDSPWMAGFRETFEKPFRRVGAGEKPELGILVVPFGRKNAFLGGDYEAGVLIVLPRSLSTFAKDPAGTPPKGNYNGIMGDIEGEGGPYTRRITGSPGKGREEGRQYALACIEELGRMAL